MEKQNDIQIKLSFKNYKGVKNGEYELTDSYLYLVKGKNDIGKTSFINAVVSLMTAKDNTPDPITLGKDEAIVYGEIPGPKGMYTIEMKITPKGTTFIMITPDNIKVNKVTDIRKIFEYNVMSVQEFIMKSYTPDGRREQIKIILNLLSEDVRKKYLSNQDKLKAGSIEWEKRKQSRANLDYNEKFIETLLEFKDFDVEELKKSLKEEYTLQSKYEEQLYNNDNSNQEKLDIVINDVNNLVKEGKTQVEFFDSEIKNLEEKIEKLKVQKEEYRIRINSTLQEKQKQITELSEKINNAPKIDKYQLKENILSIKEDIEVSRNRLDKANEYIKANEAYNISKQQYLNAEKVIEDIRAENRKILSNSDLSSMNINIEDDTLYVGSFVFNENQIADSKLMLATANILLKVLDKSKMLVIGKLAELDNTSKSMLYKLAEQNDIVVIGDEVDNNYNEIYVEGFIPEEIGNFNEFMSSLSLKPSVENSLPQTNTIIEKQQEKKEENNSNSTNVINFI